MRYRLTALVLASFLVASGPVFTQQPAPAPAPTIAPGPLQNGLPAGLDERIRALFERNEYGAEGIGPMSWLDGGRRYTAVSRTEPRNLIAYDTDTGRSEVLVPAASLVTAGQSAPLAIADYAWSTDRTKLLIFTNTRKVWRQNTRGDYWVLDRSAGTLKKLGGAAPESSLMFAKFSPDGTSVAYVRQQNIYVEELGLGAIRPLTTDGAADLINGTSDWVNEEEFSIRDGFRWSPDGRSVAYWQFDTTGVERFTLINNTASLYPATTVFAYPKPGTPNSAVRVGIVNVQSARTTWVAAEGDLRQHYVPWIAWADAGSLLLQHMNRLQNRNDLLIADAATGQTRRVFRDESDTWVDTSASGTDGGTSTRLPGTTGGPAT
jgi:dipeptidyl-peptidase-4